MDIWWAVKYGSRSVVSSTDTDTLFHLCSPLKFFFLFEKVEKVVKNSDDGENVVSQRDAVRLFLLLVNAVVVAAACI